MKINHLLFVLLGLLSAAYHYSDSVIYGFSHTHLSGTGCSDYGDILVMPTTGKVEFKNTDYASPFSHFREKAEPGYYSVFLQKPGVAVELTSTLRTGFHKYTFPASSQSNIIIDLKHRDEVLESSLEIVGNNEVRGLRRSKAWADDQWVYFVARFSKPFASYIINDQDKPSTGFRKASSKSLQDIGICL